MLLILQIVFGCLIISSYRESIRQHDRYMSPHVIMITSLSCRLVAQSLQVLHYWTYSNDGEGLLAADILYRIFFSISEIIMSMLLIQLISGWTVTY